MKRGVILIAPWIFSVAGAYAADLRLSEARSLKPNKSTDNKAKSILTYPVLGSHSQGGAYKTQLPPQPRPPVKSQLPPEPKPPTKRGSKKGRDH
jgi:hypothetical protein